MKEKGLKCNTENSFIRQTEMEYLGLWVTRHGVKPINRKIEYITNMAPPTSQKGVRKFIGVINYYRVMWPRRSHTLACLTKLTSINRKFKWTQVKQDAFNKIKPIVTCDTLLIIWILMKHLKFITMLARSKL